MEALARTDLFSQVMPWLAALLGLVAVGAIVLAVVRRRFRAHDDPGVAFTLEDLRQLRARGALTDEEYELARAQMIASLRPRSAAAPEPGPAVPDDPPENVDPEVAEDP